MNVLKIMFSNIQNVCEAKHLQGPAGSVKVCHSFFPFLREVPRFLPGTTWSLKRYCIRKILTWCYKAPLPRLWPVPSSHPRLTVVPQLLPVTSGGKQWRDVGHENGSAFVAGNCLSFCYFAASKSQMSAGVLSQTITCRDNFYDVFSFLLLPRLTALIF